MGILVAAGLIPLATAENNGLMSANDKKVYPFLGQSPYLIQVTNTFSIYHSRSIVRITGTLNNYISTFFDAFLVIYTDPKLEEKNYLSIKLISGKKPSNFKIFEKDKFIYLQIGSSESPFLGIITSTRYIKNLGVTPDDTYTDITPEFIT